MSTNKNSNRIEVPEAKHAQPKQQLRWNTAETPDGVKSFLPFQPAVHIPEILKQQETSQKQTAHRHGNCLCLYMHYAVPKKRIELVCLNQDANAKQSHTNPVCIQREQVLFRLFLPIGQQIEQCTDANIARHYQQLKICLFRKAV